MCKTNDDRYGVTTEAFEVTIHTYDTATNECLTARMLTLEKQCDVRNLTCLRITTVVMG